MGHKPDDIKGGEGSIKVGATGRVSALMIRELEDCNSVSRKRNPKSVPVSVCCGVSASSNKAGSRSNTVQRTQGNIRGKMHSYHIPMLASQDISVDKTPPVRGKFENKRSKLVEIVDLKCGRKPGKVCSSPISKKLNFSRLSVSN